MNYQTSLVDAYGVMHRTRTPRGVALLQLRRNHLSSKRSEQQLQLCAAATLFAINEKMENRLVSGWSHWHGAPSTIEEKC
jgi:hypothetical protein